MDVRVFVTGLGYAPRGGGTVASAELDNPNPFPVDVKVLAQGRDASGRVFQERTVGPIRYVRPKTPHPIQARFLAAPLKSVEFQVIEARSYGKPER